MTDTAQKKQAHHEGSVKETLIAILISLTIALAARSYATEAFIIPTGSMAPTLLGSHLDYRFEESGVEWSTDVRYRTGPDNSIALPNQVGPDGRPPAATAPMSAPIAQDSRFANLPEVGAAMGQERGPLSVRTSAGDRILVHKYLYHLREPKRFDVVVFKSPEKVTQNFIKRLIGLPSETVWLAAGDVFSTTDVPARLGDGRTVPPPDERWSIRRKPERVQRSLWRPVYSSEFAPLSNSVNGRRWFSVPWGGEGWETYDRANDRDVREYRCDTEAATTLRWDHRAWPITDWVWYNDATDTRGRGREVLPNSDVRLRAGVEPDREGLAVGATIRARGHEFRAEIEGTTARILMRVDGASEWAEMDSATIKPLRAGRVTNIEFWHADQALWLFVGQKRVAYGEYNWGPSERLLHATGSRGTDYAIDGPMAAYELNRTEVYAHDFPEMSWDFAGSPLTLHRVGVDHDVYYRADTDGGGDPGFGTHPDNLAIIGPDQFFCCGDNSPASSDGRLWNDVDPQVMAQFTDTRGPAWEDSGMKLRGVVPRQLMLGKAYFVYFPAPFSVGGKIPIPNAAEMRAIR